MSITLEKIHKLLKGLHNQELIELLKPSRMHFDRTRTFKHKSKYVYRIIWHPNVCTLKLENDIEIRFDDMNINGNWPNLYKTNINFKNENETVCILPIEKYIMTE